MSVEAAERALPEVQDVTAPPSRDDNHAAPRPGSDRSRSAVTEVIPRAGAPRIPRSSGGGVRPPRATRPKKPRLPAPAPRRKAPREGTWWAGAALLAVSVLLLSFVAHVAVFSAAQHHRAQTLAYNEMRETMAKASIPVGQLRLEQGEDGREGENVMTPLGTPLGLIESPAIGLSEVILEGSTSNVLRSGVGHRRDSVIPGQGGTAVILGRQLAYGGPFSQINRLVPGDEITVTTGQATSTFRVVSLRREGDPLPEALDPGEGRLELQTADGLALFPSGVLHVDAELVSEVQSTPSRVLGYPALPPEERAMGQNDDSWFTAFFSFVFLVAAAIGMWWLWRNWGRWHAWLVGLPVLVALGVVTADFVMSALPNLL
ncbi:sortase domain-bontaining protein [Microbacterium sp. P07]|uniref:sortase n=1 Tax=Microbacterium sp. P07 TaxID=3366952 RepID=UPI00374577EF